ncbi:MAG: pyridoxamine 5'-phosphate oxidase family protein [Proteobacteria bacterium]|jgi:general stress protein 26|nr:pyridoxamine 5'-phosphate oxidase family protein [Pseudomonadota bacterium]
MAQEGLRKQIVEFVGTYQYSNLITIDENGIPKGRMMENLPLKEDLVFYFATGAQSNKLKEIKKNPSASVFVYRPADHSSVSALGKAEIVTDDATRKQYWKEKWTAYWKTGPTDPAYVLIRIVPKKVVLLDYATHKQEAIEL